MWVVYSSVLAFPDGAFPSIAEIGHMNELVYKKGPSCIFHLIRAIHVNTYHRSASKPRRVTVNVCLLDVLLPCPHTVMAKHNTCNPSGSFGVQCCLR